MIAFVYSSHSMYSESEGRLRCPRTIVKEHLNSEDCSFQKPYFHCLKHNQLHTGLSSKLKTHSLVKMTNTSVRMHIYTISIRS